ncbi:RagB/SusD family nutrient uptake outer membrane protein [uncultured Draconibacterium sp.]|uniref:RagB/SusD family nutrient uptake outer membrane protein n=1 Tax=uncultured Draconibacterium sp. TaxID=1573823 RepID=UPI0029C6E51E|nr:RagB/SusD family nutrient uptake outer membrane protein [uncultured Draconibacterium sp.]
MKKFKTLYIFLLSGLLLFAGCDDDILDLKNPNNYDTGTFFQTEEELKLATNAVYGGLYFGGLWTREYFFIFDLIGNDASTATALQGELAEFAKYTYDAAHGQINVYWRSLYRIVLRANLVIDKGNEFLENNGPNEDVNRYIGEAKFLRAYAYSELVTQFGRVPLKTSLADLDVILTPRAPEAEIWDLVHQDLDDAISVLPASYDDPDVGRATKGAAIALKGKALLTQKNYSQAATEFAKLEGMGYDLVPGDQWYDNWSDEDAKENNIESVFEVQIKRIPGTSTWFMFGGQEDWGKGAAHTGRPMEYGFNDWQNVYISPAAVQGFVYEDPEGNEYIDPRAENTFYGRYGLGDSTWCDLAGFTPEEIQELPVDDVEKSLGNGVLLYNLEKRGYRFKKYQNYEKIFKESKPESNNNSKVIRYADVLLMRAEALIMDNKVSDGMALINRVRERVGAFTITGISGQPEAMEVLKRERHLELCGEQVRWRDLVRWGDAKSALNKELNAQYNVDENGNQLSDKVFFQDKHVLFPIPQSEKDVNTVILDDIANDWN